MADLYGPGQMRRDTAANWASGNPTMLAGEVGVTTNAGVKSFAMKLGDGTTAHSGLAFGPSVVGFSSAGGAITSSDYGAFASGYASENGSIIANNQGATAFGYAYDYGLIQAIGHGSTALGYATGSSSYIEASGLGSLAGGSAEGQGSIRASYPGSFAFGRTDGFGSYSPYVYAQNYGAVALGQATGTGTIRALGQGSFAQGSAASGESIYAGGQSSVQFAPGSNNLANSVAVGADLRLCADGAPGTPRNGDQWVASGYVYIRSNGASVKIT